MMTRRAGYLLPLLFLCSTAFGQLWSGILAPSRGANWTNAGVAGGVPSASWAQCTTSACNTVTAGPASSITAAQINAAITSAPDFTYVYLPAGTYNLTTGLVVSGRNNVEIRGAGANQTLLTFTGNNSCQGTFAVICFTSTDINWKDGPSNGPVNWTAGYSQGTTSITLASVPNLKVGNPIILDQEDDACSGGACPGTTDTGNVYVCSDSSLPAPCSLEDNGGGAQRLHRNQVQIVTVAACGGVTTVGSACSGTNVAVTISPGLYMPNWSASKNPQAWWATNPVMDVGVQNLSFDMTGAGFSGGTGVGVEFFNALNGWAQGVRGVDGSRAMVQAQYSEHISVLNSYFFLTQFSTSTSYGFECYTSSDDLIQNNIYQAVSGPLTINGACSGTVLGYNFDVNNYYTSSQGYINATSNVHTAGTDSILYEGNIGPQIYADVFHGTHNFVTLFRNYIEGNSPVCWQSGSSYSSSTWGACSGDQIPIQLYAYSRYFNIIGNVLGEPGVQTSYVGDGTGLPIYNLGYANGLTGVPGGSDALVTSTLMRWGNYDSVTAAVRWCGDSSDPGWSTTCGGASEVPSTIAAYPNPVPASTTLPPSFYLSAKPSWWPASKPWPLIGPDVTGGNVSGTAGYAYTNPAEDCYLNVMDGPVNGTGPVLGFNASSCYGSATASGKPAAATNLTGTVVTQ